MSAEDHAREWEARTAAETDPEQKKWLRDREEKYRKDPAFMSVCGGGVRLVPFEGLDAHQRFASDTEYLYDIRCTGGKLRVTAYTTVERDGVWTIDKFFEGSTRQLARRKS